MVQDLEGGSSVTCPPRGRQAIRDGVIEASINHEKGYVQSKEMIDIYSTREPQLAFHQRISFCLDIHNMSVKVRGISWAATGPRAPPVVSAEKVGVVGAQVPPISVKLLPGQRPPGGRRLCSWGHGTFYCF